MFIYLDSSTPCFLPLNYFLHLLSFHPFYGIRHHIAGVIFIGEFKCVGSGIQLERSDEVPS
jgi:hypothetical protein